MDQLGSARTGIDRYWCDSSGIYLEGWVQDDTARIEAVRIAAGEQACDIHAFIPRGEPAGAVGFRAYLPWRPSDPLTLEVRAAGNSVRLPVVLPAGPIPSAPWSNAAAAPPQTGIFGAAEMDAAFNVMLQEANAKNFTVCEVGSRNVSPGATTKRTLFPGAARYIGVDVHAADNVDLAGDAHYLDELVGEASVDLVFSIAVMEHLSFPWLFAAAVNRALRPGGLTFHMTHQAWPIHEEPNDFWRFSDNGLRVLFGPDTGFEVLAAGLHDRAYIHPEERRDAFAGVTFAPCYTHVFILARKVGDVAPDSVRWPVDREAAELLASQYPLPPGAAPLPPRVRPPAAPRAARRPSEDALAAAMQRAATAEAQVLALEQSTSWRMTGPLRRMVKRLRGAR
ncbi:class I SAM-dependent methyltransferase [Dankookia rubra]|uniref:Class I SAM-dependent methyltransferase n=1 Tax=Dankookia rubra TaxID=1442381 RepID=A0A4R5QBZ9_9PROT|nr:class I SAM-dependent methyltransferase [Dankookia rubra]TDH60630.1 class I SAM-dependent methyltransferase [Dankookia rubra]